MNVPFTLADPKLDDEFLKGAEKQGMVQLKGHRSVGGMRASIYNAMPIEGVQALVAYMKDFEAQAWLRRAKKCEILVLNHDRAGRPEALARRALRGGEGIEGPAAILVRSAGPARHQVRPIAARRRPRRRRRQQHPGRRALQARRAGVQRARRQRQRGEGAGARRHADRRAQSRRRARLRQEFEQERKTWTRQVEDGKKQYAGFELPGHTLGVIGLGKIGSLVADAAIRLGMNVLGYDPQITVEAAWSLPSQVKRATRSTRC